MTKRSVNKLYSNLIGITKKLPTQHAIGPPSQPLMAAGRFGEVTGGLPTGETLCVS